MSDRKSFQELWNDFFLGLAVVLLAIVAIAGVFGLVNWLVTR